MQRLANLLRILGTLNELHDDQARDNGYFSKTGKPGKRLGPSLLDVNQHVGIEDEHYARFRLSACRRSSRAYSSLSPMSDRVPKSPSVCQ